MVLLYALGMADLYLIYNVYYWSKSILFGNKKFVLWSRDDSAYFVKIKRVKFQHCEAAD